MLKDLRANSWSLRPCCMVVAYRVAHFCSVWRKKSIIDNLWAASASMLYHLVTECLFDYEIQAVASIGRCFAVHHDYGVVIDKNVAAGGDLTLCHGVVIGNPDANDPSCPVIGDGIELGADTTLLSDAATGDNVTVGAGSVVVDSVPDNTLVADEKARVKVIK